MHCRQHLFFVIVVFLLFMFPTPFNICKAATCQIGQGEKLQNIPMTTTVPPVRNYTPRVSLDFIKALDIGMAEVVRSSKWMTQLMVLGLPYSIPDCTSKYGTVYPPKNPFRGRKELNICYEQPAAVWSVIYRGAGNYLVDTLNDVYEISLKANHIILDTEQLGYFNTMQDALDSGKCDIVTSDIIYTKERAARVNYHCPYETSSWAFLRSGLNGSLYTTAQALNDSNVIIVVYGGTYFESVARAQFPAAKILTVNGGYDETYVYIMEQRAHATIADAVDLDAWIFIHKSNCSSCYVGLFGEAYMIGSITTRNYNSTLSNGADGRAAICFYLLVFLLIFNLVVFVY